MKKSDENYWMVGFNTNNIFCIVCKSPDLFPQVVLYKCPFFVLLLVYQMILDWISLLIQVTPKPVLSLLNFSVPLASSDIGAEALENEFILNYIHLSQVY